MKKLLSYPPIMMLVAVMALTSCSKQQAESEKEVPLKVTYTIECSRDLLNLCDMVVTYKGNDGVDVVDTISASPADSTETQTWTKTVGTHEIPVKIGFDYTLVQKTDTLLLDEKYVSLTANYTIIAEKIGVVKRVRSMSEKNINSKRNFYMANNIMGEDVINTRHNLATIIDIYNERQAYYRETANGNNCFVVKPRPNGNGSMIVEQACWNDDTPSKH